MSPLNPPVQMTAARLPRAKTIKFAHSDRFGDEPLKVPQKKPPVYGGAAPPGSTLSGYEYKPEETPNAARTGMGATSVEKWTYSEPGGVTTSKHQNRRPNEYDWMNDLGPARYNPEKLATISGGRLATRFPKYTVGGSGPRISKMSLVGENDLMYDLPKSVGKQPDAQKPNAVSLSFGDRERRLERLPRASLEERVEALELLKRTHKRQPLTTDQRVALRRDVTADFEAGRSSSETYMPASSFDRAMQPSRSKSFAFGGITSAPRFERGQPELDRAMTAAATLPPPKHGGAAWQRKVGERGNPAVLPGPGSYATDWGTGIKSGGFDGTGRMTLSYSRSMPAFSMTERGGIDKVMGKPDIIYQPSPTTYFQTPKPTKPGAK